MPEPDEDGAAPAVERSAVPSTADPAGPSSTSGWELNLRQGAVMGRYELLREIGRGGFGVVWEARDLERGRLVAFKAVLDGGQAGRHEDRLLREAEVSARLSHPNVVTLLEVGRSEHGPYLIL
ncbi:MAG TPA: protein kinase, partial [Anaeromyxobacter sp.]|nr:protein kinase [Anaeromyxobacter sp.]